MKNGKQFNMHWEYDGQITGTVQKKPAGQEKCPQKLQIKCSNNDSF